MSGQMPVMLSSRTCFYPDTTCFWPVKCNSRNNFSNSEARLHRKPFFFFNKKPTESLVCLATKLRIKSFTIFLHCRSSLAYMEWLCKPFVYITCDVLLQSFWQSPHCAFSLQVKHAKYNESRRFQSISLLI